MAIGQCKHCSKPTKQFVSTGKFAKFCGKSCSWKYNQSRRPSKSKSGLPVPRTGTCVFCSKAFIARVAVPQIYCSRRCNRAAFISRNPERELVFRSRQLAAARARTKARNGTISWVHLCDGCGSAYARGKNAKYCQSCKTRSRVRTSACMWCAGAYVASKR